MRTATFNLENLLRRAKILNLRDSDKTTKLLDKIRQLASLLDERASTAPIRAEVFDLSAELQEYIDIREDFSDQQRMNTALVVNSVNADIFCAIEVEGMEALRVFNHSVLATSYGQFIAIDSPNDPRGIDIGCLTAIASRTASRMSSIWCRKRSAVSSAVTAWSLQSTATRVHVLCNHFKSQLGAAEESAAKRPY
jgi:hypothetical protein